MTENTAGVGKRTVASGAIIGAANIYAIWASQIYRADDAPAFHVSPLPSRLSGRVLKAGQRGNDIIIAFCAVAILLWCFQGWQYSRANKTRAERYQQLNDDEKASLLENVERDGSRGILFKSVLSPARRRSRD